MVSQESEDKKYWMQQAMRLSRRINLAWFLDGFAGPLLIAAVIGSVLVLGVRRELPELHSAILSGSLAALFLIMGLIIFIRARKRFESPDQALVRIEASQKMNSALSAASAGILPWPERPKNLSESLTWHLPKTLTPPATALILLAIGLLIPIKPKPIETNTSREPQTWSQLDSQLEKLSEDAMVDETYLEDMKERLDQLRAQEEEQWFSHASLEATDSLKEAHESSLQDIQQDLSEASEAMQELTDAAKDLNSEQKQKLAEQFEDALQGLQNGAMKPNEQLLNQLSQLDPKDMGNLNKEQIEQLKQNMEKLKESLDQAGEGGQGEDWADQLLGDGGEGENGEKGEGQCPNGGACPHGEDCQGECQGNGPGNGGINRGPGHDPNVLRKPKDPLGVGDMTALEAKDLSRALPGDLLQLQDGKHTVKKDPSTLSAGGQAAKGAGGDRVWKESLNPDEQRALKSYFE